MACTFQELHPHKSIFPSFQITHFCSTCLFSLSIGALPYSKIEDRRQHGALPYSKIVNLPSLSGVDDGNVYLDWEAKVDHIFHVYKVQDDHKLRIVSLSFLDYAK